MATPRGTYMTSILSQHNVSRLTSLNKGGAWHVTAELIKRCGAAVE